MMKSFTRGGMPIWKMAVRSILMCLLVLAALTAAGALAAYCSPDAARVLRPLTLIVLCAGGALSAWINVKRCARRILPGMVAALTVCLLMMVGGVILSAGSLSPGALMNGACYLLCSLFFSLLAVKGTPTRRKRPR